MIQSGAVAYGLATMAKDGTVLKRYAPTDTPQSLAKDIEAALT